jgi:hypothetical protein
VTMIVPGWMWLEESEEQQPPTISLLMLRDVESSPASHSQPINITSQWTSDWTITIDRTGDAAAGVGGVAG